MEPVMNCFPRWGTKAHRTFHLRSEPEARGPLSEVWLCARGSSPQSVMSKPVRRTPRRSQWSLFSEVPKSEWEAALSTYYGLTNAVFEGLTVGGEIRAVATQNLG